MIRIQAVLIIWIQAVLMIRIQAVLMIWIQPVLMIRIQAVFMIRIQAVRFDDPDSGCLFWWSGFRLVFMIRIQAFLFIRIPYWDSFLICTVPPKNCRDPGSNRGPLDLQSNALPTELSRLIMFSLQPQKIYRPYWVLLTNFRSSLQCCGSGSTGSTCFWASRIWILLSSCKNSKKNLDSYNFVTLFDYLSLKNDANVASKSNKQKKLC